MTWWEDTWLQESFADYMGYRRRRRGRRLRRQLRRLRDRPQARRATTPTSAAPPTRSPPQRRGRAGRRRGRSTTSTRSPTPRATPRSRQLVTWLGDEDFLAGVNAYLTRHRFGNATLADFVDALDARHRPRRPRLGRGVAAHAPASTPLAGHAATATGRCSPARAPGRTGSGDGVRRDAAPRRQLAASTSATSRCGSRTPAVVVPNCGGETFARLRLDEQSWAASRGDLASVPDDDTRAMLWCTAFDLVRCGELVRRRTSSPWSTRHLPPRAHGSVVEAVLRGRWQPWSAATSGPARSSTRSPGWPSPARRGLASEPEQQVAVSLTRGLAADQPTRCCCSAGCSTARPTPGCRRPDLRWAACTGSPRWASSASTQIDRRAAAATAPSSATSARRARSPRPDPGGQGRPGSG